jgi:hypothetical protein
MNQVTATSCVGIPVAILAFLAANTAGRDAPAASPPAA